MMGPIKRVARSAASLPVCHHFSAAKSSLVFFMSFFAYIGCLAKFFITLFFKVGKSLN